MTKLLASLRLVLLAAFTVTLASCGLYFGDGDNEDSWTYCGSDGYYVCQGDDCQFAGSTCPSGTQTPGFTCETDADCAAGCYCEGEDAATGTTGTCVEAGFCATDEDCPEGYVCDDRTSCVPITCTCTTDQEAIDAGFGFCDEATSTCQQGVDPAGSCGGTATGTPPTCGAGSVPLILDGAYTGECKAVSQCDVVPLCEAHSEDTDENDCLARSDCGAIYVGINCTNPTGQSCTGGTGCVCRGPDGIAGNSDDFRFDACTTTGSE